MAHAGARVILASRSIDKLERAAEGLRTSGCSAAAVKLDLTDSASIKACAESVEGMVRAAATFPGVRALLEAALRGAQGGAA